MKKCYIYARVSTSEQNRGEFTSIENQIETCKHFLALKQADDWQLVDTVIDPGYSGKDLERPGIKQLMNDIREKRVDVVITYKVDRVSRSLVKFYEFNKLLEDHGVEFASATQSFDTSNSSGRLMLNMLLSFAEYERELISERTSDKMEANFERGRWGGGLAPYGYEHDPETKGLRVHKHEAKGVKLMFENISNGATLAETCDLLFNHGYKTKERTVTRKNGVKANIGGLRFREDVLFRMVKNPFYAGYIRYKGKQNNHQYERIIPRKLYDKANHALKRKPDGGKDGVRVNADKHIHLLKGIIKCQECGSTMTPVPSGKKDKNGNPYLYYTCSEVSHYRNGSKCPVRSFSARDFENTIIHYLKDLSANSDVIRGCIRESNKGTEQELKDLSKQEKQLTKEVKRLTAEIKRLLELVKKGKLKAGDAHKELDDLTAERSKVESDLEKVQVKTSIHTANHLDAKTTENCLLNFSHLIDKGTMKEKKELMHLLIKEITVETVNHKKQKAPTEAGAFDFKLRTRWFRIVTTLFITPNLPVSYDESEKKFVFSNKWLPRVGSNHGQTD